ncbi:hypothetical protein [Tessaracoccus sp. ZS01]|uniref:hypothetical protein n=1 Tax=Tessaracoccus sp. ZS01 TaxID=1906324 RepID=UPI00096FCD69|nr:hypothetical protein [Tessaracoccus sp. ZS01]MCG6567706.1 hypothetical protein [Tessaracoccus sp. ZS01]OMG55779.1 hypothetical protein BJN44_08785 [Tessaracoccus sp. ZS01]
MTSDPFDLLDEVASVLPPAHWMLVGGLMVHAHATLAGVENNRPTIDADIVVEVMTSGSYQAAARAIQQLGFEPHDPVNPDAPSYRFDREADRIDLMIQDRRRAVRFQRRTVLQVPASDSALKNTNIFVLPSGSAIRIPTLAGALALKGAACATASPNPIRHAQDGIVLLACADALGVPTFSKSQTKHVNRLLQDLNKIEAWSLAGPVEVRRAMRAVRVIKSDWETPAFLASG